MKLWNYFPLVAFFWLIYFIPQCISDSRDTLEDEIDKMKRRALAESIAIIVGIACLLLRFVVPIFAK